MVNLHKEVDEIDGMPENKKSHVKSIISKASELIEMLQLENKDLKHKLLSMEESLKMKDSIVVVRQDEVKA